MMTTEHNAKSPGIGDTLPLKGGIPFVFPGIAGVGCLFSTVLDGDMAIGPSVDDNTKLSVRNNRKHILAAAGVTGWVELKQVHEDHVLIEPEPTDPGEASLLKGDGSCTSRRHMALVIKTADCQPILLTNREGSAVAALHVGWRGNVMSFPASGVRRFCETYGMHAGDVLAVRGPSLGPGASEFVNFSKEWPLEFTPWFHPDTKTMDLWTLTRHQLVNAGVLQENIFSVDLCTQSLPELFFSYRRGHAGRQVSLVWLK